MKTKKIIPLTLILTLVCIICAFSFYNNPNNNIRKQDDNIINQNNEENIVKLSENSDEKQKNNIINQSNAENIIIYNTHAYENYACGLSISDVSKTLSSKINHKNICLDNPNTGYEFCYETSKKLIENSQLNYKDSILLDIHRMGDEENKNAITICIGKGNINYEKNKRFAQDIVDIIKKNNKDININIVEENPRYNQDLSDKALLIEISNVNASKETINNNINTLANAIDEYVK